MMPHCLQDHQFELFEEIKPLEKSAPLALPFQRTQEINVDRLCNILGISNREAQRMLRENLFRAYRLGRNNANWRIEYDSVVDFCNSLRLLYRISPALQRPTGRRLRDEELLPFPLSQTLMLREACTVLDVLPKKIFQLLEEGAVTGYQIGSWWRIHRPSMQAYLERLRQTSTPRTIATDRTRL